MALTTKRFTTPIQFGFAHAISTSFSYSESDSGSGGGNRVKVLPYYPSISSSITSTIYTVPTGRTAKVYINQFVRQDLDWSESYYVSTRYSSGSYIYVRAPEFSIDYLWGIRNNSYFSDSLNSYFIRQWNAGEYDGVSYSSFGEYNSSSSSIVSSINRSWSTSQVVTDFSDSIRGINQFMFLGPGQSLDFLFGYSYNLYQMSIWLWPNTGFTQQVSGSIYLSISTNFLAYLNLTVIEESGS